jgi:uncharacterized membrane protein YdfJ with MMPL/SSD domain
MFAFLSRFVYRRLWLVLIATIAGLAFAVTWGTGVFGSLGGGGFEDPDSESSRADQAAAAKLERNSPDVVLLFTGAHRTVDDPAYRAAVDKSLADIPAGYVETTTTYWSTGSARFVSHDRRSTYAVVQLVADRHDSYDAISAGLARPVDGITVQRGGNIPLDEDIDSQVERDIQRAEVISLPIVLVLLVVIFGGLVAASMPLAIGGLAILGAFTLLRVMTLITDVSVFSVNIVTMLGLGLAIDYALFIVSRFREELSQVGDVQAALERTMATAGRTVAFSGITIAVSLASLLFFPQVFLRSMGIGGMSAVLVAIVGALTVLPALLAVLGRRVNSLQVPLPRRRRGAQADTADEHGLWYRLSRSVMRRPLIYVVVLLPLLLLLGSPFLRVQFGGIDYRALPERTESRAVAERLDTGFPAGTETIDSIVTFAGPVASPPNRHGLQQYVAALDRLPGTDAVEVTGVADDTARVSVRSSLDPIAEQARELVQTIRDEPAPTGAEALVGGQSAELADLLSSLGRTVPWMALFVLVVTLVLLFLAFGSVVLPVKAVAMNVLSLSASFGAIVWIFQDGHLADFLGFTPTGTVEATQPILMLAVAFGLSMDYEVFLLSRIREQWDRIGDNTAAVATGVQRTGRIITSAAVLLAIVIGAFSTSGITFIKMIGVGLLLAILIDATVVRALLVPATMRLLGTANWWAPGPLAGYYGRFGFRERSEPAPRAPAPAPQESPGPREQTASEPR